jgi:hypothetical protein
MKKYIIFGFMALVAFIVFSSLRETFTFASPGQTVIQSTILDGKSNIDSNVALPQSLNQDQGITFSYSCWIRIDDFTYRPGVQKVIFTKGPTDLSSSCPSLLIDGNSNTLLVKLDTFGATEVVPVSNIPAKKWLHVAIVVEQKSVDVYINGVLHTHHSIVQIPRQNSGTVHTGINGGFEGKLANLIYYNYFLKPTDIPALMKNPPQADPSDSNAPLPPYFDISWWIGR